jgi:hypothetical protein
MGGLFFMANSHYCTKSVSDKLKAEIVSSIQNINGWGSVEIFIQDFNVIQITEKNIKKPNNNRK